MTNSYDINVVHEYLKYIGKLDEFSKYISASQATSNVTLVTGLWNLGRSKLNGWAQRDFEVYKQKFFQLLTANIPMVIYAPSSLHKEIWEIRSAHNTRVWTKEVSEFKTWFPFFSEHESIRTNPNWYNRAGWLKDSPQAALPFYNPMMMTKMFMVNDASIVNPFQTEYFYWIDGGLTATVPTETLTNPSIYQNISNAYSEKIVHIAYPYEAATEVHGFEKNSFYRECGIDLREASLYISRGGFWGGHKKLIHEYNALYYDILETTIRNGDIGADECLFTIAAYRRPDLIERFLVNADGLVYPFFEELRDLVTFNKNTRRKKILTTSNAKTTLYVLGFNSPKQFERLCESMQTADPQMFSSVRKILINNTLDDTLFDAYDTLCTMYNFEEIHLDNIGICGGRQFVAEHFDQSDADFYFFFEDDMLLNDVNFKGTACKKGFRTYIDGLYHKILQIMITHKFDLLKLSFSEFYGDNSTQWAWYNVPQEIRTKYWPEYDVLPTVGLDPNAPRTTFNKIYETAGVPYITGEIYYSNWPQIVSREGNTKMFLNTKWEHPHEQTWMSHMYQLARHGEFNPAVLLASPITHDRFDHYEGTLRKES